jgi:uncharacterized protein (TIGR00297 family)
MTQGTRKRDAGETQISMSRPGRIDLQSGLQRPKSDYDETMNRSHLGWQSKMVLLVVLPYTAVSVVVQAREWFVQQPSVALWTLELSAVLGLLAWRLSTATPAAALTGAVINASLMFSMFNPPFRPWRTGFIPLLTVLVLTSFATRFGRRRKESLGTAEKRRGRGAAQVAANLGMAALVMDPSVQSALFDTHWFWRARLASLPIFALGLAALAEAAADTVSSEIGQVLGGTPRMITTLRRVEPGTDGGITLAGSAAGVVAAALVAFSAALAFHLELSLILMSWAAGVFGLFFDSLLGATLERAGWLNNDAVNFLSTASAVACSLALLAVAPHPGVG